jgi:hypothetical protein
MNNSAFHRRMAAAVGTAAAVTAISSVLAPTAQADTEYGAIAVSPSASVAGKAWDAPTRPSAESGAMSYCGHSDCKVLASFRGCGAIAYNGNAYQGGYGNSLATAELDALGTLGGGSIVSWACND